MQLDRVRVVPGQIRSALPWNIPNRWRSPYRDRRELRRRRKHTFPVCMTEGRGAYRFAIARGRPSGQAVFRLQCRHVATLIENVAAIGNAVSEDERWSITLDPVMDRNAFVVDA